MLAFALLTVALDCTVPAKTGGALPTERRVLADNADPLYRSQVDTLGTGEDLDANVEKAWAGLKSVYADFGLILNVEDQPGGRLGVRGAKCMRRLGKAPLSTYISCGDGVTGPNADSYRVTLTVISTVRASGDKSSVATAVIAEALDMSGNASDRIGCTTTGRLEVEIAKRLRAKLGVG